MRNKCFVVVMLVIALLVLQSYQKSHATILSEHFGITLSVDGSGNFNNSWVPLTSTADRAEGDYATVQPPPGPSPWTAGAELFDVETLYFDDNTSNLYFAVVTSMPSSGVAGSGFSYPSYTFYPGDIAFGFGGSPGNRYSTSTSWGYEYGIKTIGPNAGKIYATNIVPTWYYDKDGAGYTNAYPNQGSPQYPKFDESLATELGSVTNFNYYNAGVTERGFDTYVIEGIISKGLLETLLSGTNVSMRFLPDCQNDYLSLLGDIDAPPIPHENPVPEPGSIMLLGSGLVGLYVLLRRRFEI